MKLVDFILSTREEADPWNACIEELVLSLPEEDQEKIADWFIVNDEVDVRLSVEFLLNDCKYEEKYLLKQLLDFRFNQLVSDLSCVIPVGLAIQEEIDETDYSIYFGTLADEEQPLFEKTFRWTKDFKVHMNSDCFHLFKTFPNFNEDDFGVYINVSKILN